MRRVLLSGVTATAVGYQPVGIKPLTWLSLGMLMSDRLHRELDTKDTMARMDRYAQQAFEMVLSGKAQKAFRVDLEPDRLRDAYGRDSLGEKALLARRLIEAGICFVVVSGAWGYFDHHGDEVRWGGIVKGLKPLLPRVDGVIYTLVNDLEARGLLDSTLILT